MPKLSDQQIKFLVWAIAFIGVVVLIALGKIPVDSLKYLLMYAAGAIGHTIPSEDSNESNNKQEK